MIEEHPIYKEVAEAYYDCWNTESPWEECEKHRNLDFRASKAVDRDTAIAILEKVVSSYNDFTPDLLKCLPEDCQITIAREGSVCIYVTGLGEDEVANRWAIPGLECDEWHYHPEDYKSQITNAYAKAGETRIWWD
jgi:hypothetical protein